MIPKGSLKTKEVINIGGKNVYVNKSEWILTVQNNNNVFWGLEYTSTMKLCSKIAHKLCVGGLIKGVKMF